MPRTKKREGITLKKNAKKRMRIGSVLKSGLAPTSKILLGVAGVLACASVATAQAPALGAAREAAIARYAGQYIGHPYGKHVLKGIVWVESRYGKYKFGDGSFGIAQLELPTARYVAEKYGWDLPRSNKALKRLLVRDDALNIRLAAAYLGLLERRFGSINQAVVAYNIGPTEASSLDREGKTLPATYVNKVMAAAARSLRAERGEVEPARSLIAGVKDYMAGLLNRDALIYMTVNSSALQPGTAR